MIAMQEKALMVSSTSAIIIIIITKRRLLIKTHFFMTKTKSSKTESGDVSRSTLKSPRTTSLPREGTDGYDKPAI